MSGYAPALKRFRFVLLLGVMAGSALGIVSSYSVGGGFPPKLAPREQPTYTAGTQLEVTSPAEPYYRSAIDVPIIAGQAAAAAAPEAESAEGGRAEDEERQQQPEQPLTFEDEPVVSTLVAAANYYPYVIEGDAVKALRERMFGVLPGEVEATAIGATITPSRQEPGRLPFIQLVASSDSPEQAVALAQQTAEAFIRFVRLQQERREIRPEQRLLVKQLKRPARTFAVGGTSPSLPILILVAVSLAAIALALLLDRVFPRRDATVAAVEEHGDEAFRRSEARDERLAAASARNDA